MYIMKDTQELQTVPLKLPAMTHMRILSLYYPLHTILWHLLIIAPESKKHQTVLTGHPTISKLGQSKLRTQMNNVAETMAAS